MKLAHLAAFAVALSVQVGGLRIERRGAGGGETISDDERAVRAARQYRPAGSKRNTTPVFLRVRQAGPSTTPCPIGSQRVDALCVPCTSLGRVDNTAPGQSCGACIDPQQVVGEDEVCRDAPCADPNAVPLPEGGCGECVEGYTRLAGYDTCVLACNDPNAQQSPEGGCGDCSEGYTRVAGSDTCVLACDDPNAEQDPNGGCGTCEAGYTKPEGAEECVAACSDPNAEQSPGGGCGQCRDGFTRPDGQEPCVSCASLELPGGTGGECGAACSPPLVYNPSTSTCTCPIDSTGATCATCSSLNRENTGEEGECGDCVSGYVEAAGTCVLSTGVVNGGFEIGTGTLLAPPWVRSGELLDSGFSFASGNPGNTQCHTGSRCWHAGSVLEQPNVVFQTVQLIPNAVYSLAFYVMTYERSNAPGETQELHLRVLEQGGAELISTTIIEGGTAPRPWFAVDPYSFSSGATGQVTIEFSGRGSGGSWTFVDDVSVTLQP